MIADIIDCHICGLYHGPSEKCSDAVEMALEKAKRAEMVQLDAKDRERTRAEKVEAERDELKAEVERLKLENHWLMIQISMCRSRMSEKDVASVCDQWSAMKKEETER